MPSNPKSTRVILLRHGRSTYNDLGLYQGSSDLSRLNPQGQVEAQHTGSLLSHLDLGAIYCSPLQRAQQMLAPILTKSESPISVFTHPSLREIDLPNWEGLSIQEVRENHSGEYRLWQEQPHQFQIKADKTDALKKSFPVVDLYQRAAQFWAETLPYYRGEILLVVSHAGTIRALISTAIGLEANHYHHLQQSNAGLSLLEFRSNRAELQVMNLTTHIGETLPKLKEGKKGLRLLLLPTSLSPVQSYLLQSVMEGVEIDFSFISGSSPIVVNSKHTFLVDKLWQGIIKDCWSMDPPSDRPLTGVILASEANLRELIQARLMPEIKVPLTGLSVLHFPAKDRPPILQALNLYSYPAIQLFA